MVRKLLYGVLVGLGAAAVAVALWAAGFLDRWEYNTWALRVRAFAGPGAATDRVKIILLDQASLDWGKRENGLSWPWPREVYGPILDFCRRSGAQAVGFDVLYTEPSVYGAGDDAAFGDAIRRGAPLAAAVFLGTESGEAEAWPDGVPAPDFAIEGLADWLERSRASDVVAPRAAFPIPEAATNAAWLANVSDQPDDDGVFRRAALFRVFDDRPIPSLGLAVYLAAVRASGGSEPVRIEAGWLHIGARRIPIDSSARSILRFRGPSGTHETFSAASVVQSELRLQAGEEPVIRDADVFKDCYVLFGFSAPGLLDLRPTPVSKVYPGVEIHATILDNLLSAAYLKDVPRHAVVIAAFVLALLSGVFVTLSRRVWQSVLAFVIFLPVPALAGFAGYAAGAWWPIMVSEVAVALALVGAVVVNYATEGRQKAFIKQAFKYYLGEQVIDQLLADPARLKLGGEKRELTLFFSDIEKFSSFSERLDPEALTSLLNDYLSDMGEIIKAEGGYLDKYIGDAIVAFWNAPVDQADHAVRACRAALRCQRRLAERAEDFRRRTGTTVKMRIGLNTGFVVVGNMGSSERFNYTVFGDAANLASRLEGANKVFGTYLLVSDSTWQKAAGQVQGRELGQLRVVGRQAPVRVYQLAGLAGETVPAPAPEFEKGLRLCYDGRWADALAVFETYPEDAPSKGYAERCRKQLADPSQSWDGILNLTEK